MKKILNLFLALTIAATLVGCSSDTETTTTTTETSDETVNLTMWVHVTDETDEGVVYADRAAAFNEAHDNINVEVEFIPRAGGGSGYEDKINTALTTNTLPDVITLDGPNTAAYADAAIIAPITEYVSEEDKADYLTSIIEQGTYQDEIYALGGIESTVGLFYNTDLLAKYNIEPGTMENPWTWTDLYTAAKTITDGESYPALDLSLSWTGEWKIYAYAPLVWSNGGSVIGEDGLTSEGIFNSKENAEALAYIQKLVNDGVTSVTPEESNFQSGKSGFMLNGAWLIPDLEKNYADLNWGVMPYPVSDNTKELDVPTGSWQFAATASSEHPAEAALLVQWMTNTDSCVAISKALGTPPARYSAIPLVEEYNEGARKVLMDQLIAGGHKRPVSVIYPVISRSFEEAIDAVIYGDDPQATLDSKVAGIEREAARYQ